MLPSVVLLALGLASASPATAAVQVNQYEEVGSTLVSAMMMFVGNDEKVYMLDKAEGNEAQVAGHPAWGSVWDIGSRTAEVMDVRTNVFCASGMHAPNGSFYTFGGNGAVGRGGNIGSQVGPTGTGAWDSEYQDFDGGNAIRILNPCSSADDMSSSACQWFDDPEVLAMQKRRWYSTAEPTGEGVIVLIGGFVNGGYINRNTPNSDPEFEGGAAECTYELFPSGGQAPQPMQFLIKTSGLNAYPHTFLMPSGKMFVQANVSTMLWDYTTNEETPLPDMPGGVVRVYPASGAVAMLPLTPENNYNPTILFCGGSDMPDDAWGNYSFPAIDTWLYPASRDCQRITPEPEDGSPPAYEQDDDMLDGRTMGQFIILPNGKLFVVNGGLNGTAGYAQATGETFSFANMAFGESLASGPVLSPAIYDPNAPRGSRWSNTGLGSSRFPRLYHSSAILLPDGSVLIAGSNPNVDVNTSTIFPTTYEAEYFFPDYFSAATRPAPQGFPSTLSYGGDSFDIAIPSSSYAGAANDAAHSAQVVVIRNGFTTHAMNMGQRYMQLNNTFTVEQDGTITLHVAQPHPNPNLLQPGPAFLYVNINGIPSNGSYVIVGNGQIGAQPTAPPSVLPASVERNDVTGSGQAGSAGGNGDNTSSASGGIIGRIVGPAVGALVVLGVLGALFGLYIYRRRRQAQKELGGNVPGYHQGQSGGLDNSGSAVMTDASRDVGPGMAMGAAAAARGVNRDSDSSAFLPSQRQDYNYGHNSFNNSPYSQNQNSSVWNSSSASLTNTVYNDHNGAFRGVGGAGVGAGGRMQSFHIEPDPYSSKPMDPHSISSAIGGHGHGQSHYYPPQRHHAGNDGTGYWNSDYYRQSQSNGPY